MKTHKQWLISTIIITAMAALVVSVAYKKIVLEPVYETQQYFLSKETHTIFVGASHAACSFDPKQIPGSENIARSGEPIFFTYYKLRKVLSDNPQIKRVYLSFGPIHISKYQDINVFDTNSNSRNMYLDYFFLLNEKDYRHFDWYNEDFLVARSKFNFGLPLSYLRDLKLTFKLHRGTLTNSSFNFWGGQILSNEVHLQPEYIDKKIKLYFYAGDELVGLSPVAIDHFRSIVQLCKEKNVQLMLVRTPLHKSFAGKVPEYYNREYELLVTDILAKSENIIMVDYSGLELKDEFFLDGDHLNATGSAYFTKLLAVGDSRPML